MSDPPQPEGDSAFQARPQTGLRAAVTKVNSRPRLALPLVQSYITHRVIGPLTSRWRAGAVALFHTGRCGSTVLSDLIGQHPDVYWDGETYGRVVADIKAQGLNRSEVQFDPVDYVANRMKRSGRSWFGYDLKFSHFTEFGMTEDEYLARIEQLGIGKLIVLRRRNYLRQVISAQNGSRRGQYHLQQDTRRERLPPLNLEPRELAVDLYSGSLLEHLERWDQLYSSMERLTKDRALWLTYEDHIEQDPLVAYTMVTNSLALDSFEPIVHLKRSNPEPVSALLANYDEVRSYLADSPYAWMTEDDHT